MYKFLIFVNLLLNFNNFNKNFNKLYKIMYKLIKKKM